MTVGRREREENQQLAFSLMMRALGNQAIDTTLFDSGGPPFAESILRTTWEELVCGEYVTGVRDAQFRLTPKGWLAALELSGAAESAAYRERLGRVLAAMKSHVRGRHESKVVDLQSLAAESHEPEGFVFNIIDSRASSPVSAGRRGARWFEKERGRLVEIPVDFNMEPVDIAAALTIPHLEKLKRSKSGSNELKSSGRNITARTAMQRSLASRLKTFLSIMRTSHTKPLPAAEWPPTAGRKRLVRTAPTGRSWTSSSLS
jgi:hypothetical protein